MAGVGQKHQSKKQLLKTKLIARVVAYLLDYWNTWIEIYQLSVAVYRTPFFEINRDFTFCRLLV